MKTHRGDQLPEHHLPKANPACFRPLRAENAPEGSFDEETGLDYFGARYYAPWLGRWTTADPLGLQAGLNLYLYGRASPVVFIDPSGTQEKKAGILDVNVTELDREVGSAVGSFIHAVTPGFLIADALGADTKGSLQRLATGPTKALAERGEAAVKATTTAASLSAGPIGWVSGALTHEEGLAGYTKDVAGVGLGVARLPAAGADLISGLGLGIVGAAAAGSDEEALYHATNATLSAADLAALTALASGVAAEAKQLANAVESGGPAAGSPKGGGGGRTVFRALNPDDVSRLEQGLGIRPKGVKGTPAQHVVGEKPTKYVSASETQAGAERFETPGQGIVEIDVGRAIQGGSKIVEGPEITKSIRAELKGEQRRRAVRDTERVNEVLFEDGIPFDAIIKWLRD